MAERVKLWTATRDSQAGFSVQEEQVLAVADRNNFMAISPNGVVITGSSIVLNTPSENIRNGGLFVKMNDFTQLIPTTLVTPMPGQIPFTPLAFITSIMKDMGFMTSLMNPPPGGGGSFSGGGASGTF